LKSYLSLNTPHLPSLPFTIHFILTRPQDRVYRYGFGFDEKSSTVFYWTVVHATWYTPMNFRAFPFDNQVRTAWLNRTVTLMRRWFCSLGRAQLTQGVIWL
jgi:hypothetical protein